MERSDFNNYSLVNIHYSFHSVDTCIANPYIDGLFDWSGLPGLGPMLQLEVK